MMGSFPQVAAPATTTSDIKPPTTSDARIVSNPALVHRPTAYHGRARWQLPRPCSSSWRERLGHLEHSAREDPVGILQIDCIERHDPRPARAAPEARGCDAPKRVTAPHGIDRKSDV